MVMSDKEKRTTAYHEAGHALVSSLLPKSDPVHKVTIVPRGRAMGVTSYLPENDNRSYDREYLSHRIATAMGGRAAEEVIFNEITTGASNDIQQATDMARNMVMRWGMSDSLGPIVLGSDETHDIFGRDMRMDREYSEETAVEIDEEVRRLVQGHHDLAVKLLKENLDVLHRIAETLLEEEIIDGSRILEFLGEPSGSPALQPER
jgi:cell division protease FtsH